MGSATVKSAGQRLLRPTDREVSQLEVDLGMWAGDMGLPVTQGLIKGQVLCKRWVSLETGSLLGHRPPPLSQEGWGCHAAAPIHLREALCQCQKTEQELQIFWNPSCAAKKQKLPWEKRELVPETAKWCQKMKVSVLWRNVSSARKCVTRCWIKMRAVPVELSVPPGVERGRLGRLVLGQMLKNITWQVTGFLLSIRSRQNEEEIYC